MLGLSEGGRSPADAHYMMFVGSSHDVDLITTNYQIFHGFWLGVGLVCLVWLAAWVC